MRTTDAMLAALLLVEIGIARPAGAVEPVAVDTRGQPTAGPQTCGQLVDAQTCRECHADQYRDWSVSEHANHDVQCYECHGGLHSGSLCGCKRCHQAIHKKRFANWPHVTRFDDKDSADYMCMLCHKAHMGNLQANLKEGCAVCHGSAGHTALTDFCHTKVASAISPMQIDQFARERHGLAARLAIMPRGYAAAIGLAMAMGGYALCFLLLLPLGYTTSAVWEFLAAGSKQQNTQAASSGQPGKA